MDDKQTTLNLFDDDYNVLDEIEDLKNELDDFDLDSDEENGNDSINFSNNSIVDFEDFSSSLKQTEEQITDNNISLDSYNNQNNLDLDYMDELTEQFEEEVDKTAALNNEQPEEVAQVNLDGSISNSESTITFDPTQTTDPNLFGDTFIDLKSELDEQVEEVKISVEDTINIVNQVEYGRVNIMVIGIGGCGCNAINRMYGEQFDEIKLVAIDTSKDKLDSVNADYKMLVGENLFGGHGSGVDILRSEKAFEEAKPKIRQMLTGIDMVFLAGGIGRGTGSVGLVEIGKIAREMNILTIGFATLPRHGETNKEIIEKYYPQFIEAVDSNIIVDNEKVSKITTGLPIMEAMRVADSMLVEGISGIFELITNPGKINLDYADIKTAFSDQGSCIMGIGKGKGEDAVIKAIQESIHSDIANVESVKNARTIIFNITCSPRSVTIDEASRGSDLIYSFGHRDNIEHLLFGYSYDESLDGEVKVTFIATGTTPTEIPSDIFSTDPNKFKNNFVKSHTNKTLFDDELTPHNSEDKKEGREDQLDIPDFFS